MTDEVMAQLRSFAAGYLADAVASGVPKLQARRTIVFSQLFGELDRLRAENAALLEIAQAVIERGGQYAVRDVVLCYNDNGGDYECPFCSGYEEPSKVDEIVFRHEDDCPITRARALLGEEAQR